MMHQAFKYHKASVWYRKKINEILKFFKKQEKKQQWWVNFHDCNTFIFIITKQFLTR